MNTGDTKATNQRAYHIRVRFHKMYYYYKPGKSYWMLVILARKVSIAFCSLVFRTNPGFMLASIVGIMFIAFSLQTKHSPFMSTSQRQLVLAEHSIKAESGDRTHLHIQSSVQHVKTNQKRQTSARKQVSQSSRLSQIGAPASRGHAAKHGTPSATYFFDYNTVELSLLFCAVLVCLAGIMFESDRFKETIDSGKMRYAWQRDMVTYVVIAIVFSSFVYLALVMINEVTGYTPAYLRHACKNKQNALLSAADTIQDQKDDHVEMSILNPARFNGLQDNERAKLEAEMKRTEEEARVLKSENAALAADRLRMRQLHAQGRGAVNLKKKKGRKNRKKNATEFGPSRVDQGFSKNK
jgi:hypothetical protein